MREDRMLLVPALIDFTQYHEGGAVPLTAEMDYFPEPALMKRNGLEFVVKALRGGQDSAGTVLVFTGQATPDAREGGIQSCWS